MTLNRYCVVLVGITVGLLALSPVTTAQRVTGRILTGAQVFEEEGCMILRVQFSIPMRYTSHFPEEAGDQIRIRVTPFALSNDDQAAVSSREAVRPPYDVEIPATDISYDGTSLEGPVLLVEFRRPLTYSVGQGSDFRSILIGVPGPERLSPCI